MAARRRRWTSSDILAWDDADGGEREDAEDGWEGEDAKGGGVDGRERWVVDPGGEDDDGDGGKPRVARTRGVEKPGAGVNFITRRSPEGKQVIKAAHASSGNKLRGISTWRKAMWDDASKRAPITFLDSHTPLPGVEGTRCVGRARAICRRDRRGRS